MCASLEYHRFVRRSIPASLALFGAFLLPLFLVCPSPSQNITGSSSSGHSSGVAVSGPTSAGHYSSVPTHSGVTSSTPNPHSPNPSYHNSGTHRPRSGNGTGYYYPYFYAIPVPYAVNSDAGTSNDANGDDEANYQGGPTIFDRRGSGPDSYIPPVADPSTQTESDAAQYSEPDPPQPPTLLVFKDGHELEVENYAIVNQTLYDLTRGHPRKIAIADLDLPATEKRNDDRGVAFQLPPSVQGN